MWLLLLPVPMVCCQLLFASVNEADCWPEDDCPPLSEVVPL